jgi:predicted TIM-barrel fold metal-dependent hydrolase
MKAAELKAIDVHVHLEPGGTESEADSAAKKYFGDSGAARDPKGMAEYYRSRQIGCVVFTVDERLTGRRAVTNDAVAEFAAANSDIAIAFASIDPTRGPAAVQEARRLVSGGVIKGLKLHPPLQQFFPNDPIAYPLRDLCRSEVACAVPHRSQRDRLQHAGWRRHTLKIRQPDEHR